MFRQISETLILKFTVITPESLDMSRMIMSVVSAAIGGEQQGSGGSDGGGSASLVSNTLYADKAGFTFTFWVVIYSHLVTDLDQCMGFHCCGLTWVDHF